MSGIIDEAFILYNYPSRKPKISPLTSNDRPKLLLHQNSQIIKLLQAFLLQFNSEHLSKTITPTLNNIIVLKIPFHDSLLKPFILIVTLVVNLNFGSIQISSSLLDESGPFQIQTLDRRILFCKLFSKPCFNQQNKIVIDLHSGDFKIIRPTLFSFQQNFIDVIKSNQKSQNLHFNVTNAIKDSIFIFPLLLKELRKNTTFESISNQQNQAQLLKSLHSYLIKSPIEPAFDDSYETSKFEKVQNKSTKQAEQTKRMMDEIVIEMEEFQSHVFYTNPDFPLNKLGKLYNKEYFESRESQIAFLKERIEPPPVPVKINANSTYESKFIFNIIEINELFEIRMNKINSGGFSDISRAEVQFWYLVTVSNERMEKMENLKEREIEIKPSANKIKKLSRKQLVFKSSVYRGSDPGRNRISHECKIISKFKGLSSVFFPEYFKVKNEKSPFSQYLIMEFLKYPTLNQYREINQCTMSFLTKIHIASLLIQSIKFLSSYEIVHLDLKPTNIIIAKRMMTKLIDFGQSYHKEICDKNFKPAFSMPYGSPEIFDGIGKTEFNEKQDVYSWGVILFEMLFRRLPFFFARQKASKIFKERAYLKYIYFVPQEEASYGSCEIMTLLRNAIFRTLDKDACKRPCTVWLTVLLKECLSYLINLEFNNVGL